MKILFLDFDGVLNSWAALHAGTCPGRGGLLGLCPKHVALLNEVIRRTGCDVVVSSSWRIGTRCCELKDVLRAAGFEGRVVGVTPQLPARSGLGFFASAQRGDEIQAWLDKHPDITAFAIVDDDADMAHLASFLVRTDYNTGLCTEHVEKLCKLLGEGDHHGAEGGS